MYNFIPRNSLQRVISPILSAASATITIGLLGCSSVGVTSIDQGRTPYNEVIHDTSREQTLLNIVRVSNDESPLFMDVAEVDQATLVTGSISGGPSGIGAAPNTKTSSAGTLAGAVGFITGTATYQEAPTVRYLPLAGQPLIAQVSTPLTPESLVNLINSDWPTISLYDLSIDRLTPGYSDFDTAVDAIADLQQYGAVIIAATQAPEPGKSVKLTGLTVTQSAPPTKDSITLYKEDNRISVSQAQCDGKSDKSDRSEKEARKVVDALWARLENIFDQHGPTISIQSKGSPALVNGKAKPPLLATRSALAIMIYATAGGRSFFEIKPAAEVRNIIADHQSRLDACNDDFYTVDPTRPNQSAWEHGNDVGPSKGERTAARLVQDKSRSLLTMYPERANYSFEDRQAEKALASARRFMLIAYSDTPPTNAFVSVRQQGKWYYIFDDDAISKKTLALISQINTIQAIPSQTPPLTPTISVGPR